MTMAAWALSALRHVVLFLFRITLRVARVCMMATLIGLGGGMGGLGGGRRKIVKPEPDNPIVCVAEASMERK